MGWMLVFLDGNGMMEGWLAHTIIFRKQKNKETVQPPFNF
jgi:hypothetical protein